MTVPISKNRKFSFQKSRNDSSYQFKEAVDNTVAFERIVEPNIKNKEIYSEIQDRWTSIYKVQLELTKQGVTESLWRAPGE